MARQLTRKRPHARSHTQVQTPRFLAGDVILFASTGDLYSKVGRWLMQGEHEGPTYAVHTAQFLDHRRVLEMDMVVRIKNLDDVLERRYGRDLRKHRGFEVWRCPKLTAEQRKALTREALTYVNVRFGFAKFSAHMLDDFVCKLLRKDVFLFRHIDPQDRRPVCSGITATVYDRALQYRFGVDPECADPDQIYDWITGHPEEWVRVFRLGEYPQDRANQAVLSAD